MTRNQDSTVFVASALVVSACVAFSMKRSHKLEESSTYQRQRAARSIQHMWWRFSRTTTVDCNRGNVSNSEEQEDPAITVEPVHEFEEDMPAIKENCPVIPISSPTEDRKLVEVSSPVRATTTTSNEKKYFTVTRGIDEDDSSLPDMLPHDMSPRQIAFPVKGNNKSLYKPVIFLVVLCTAIVMHIMMPMTALKSSDLILVVSPLPQPTNFETCVSPDDNKSSLIDMLHHDTTSSQIAVPVKEGINNSVANSVFFSVGACAAIVMHMMVHVMTSQSNDSTSVVIPMPFLTHVETVVSQSWRESNQTFVKKRTSIDLVSGIYGPFVSYRKNAAVA